jgi:DNA-binding NarL/FixJ family response regulator
MAATVEAVQERYTRSLERHLDATLFERGRLVHEPATAASLVRAALSLADGCRAKAVVVAGERLAAARPDDACLTVAAMHARGVLEREATLLLRASHEYDDEWARASAAEDAAVVLSESGDQAGALAQLARARSGYQSVDAQHDLDRVRARMRRHGVRVRHRAFAERPSFGWDSLTETERRVVDLAVDGLTNRQIAQHMFLSPHTVAFHLRQVFRKLGINCRVQLPRLVTEHSVAGQCERRA